MIDTGDA